jgi:hypothetical protein
LITVPEIRGEKRFASKRLFPPHLISVTIALCGEKKLITVPEITGEKKICIKPPHLVKKSSANIISVTVALRGDQKLITVAEITGEKRFASNRLLPP